MSGKKRAPERAGSGRRGAGKQREERRTERGSPCLQSAERRAQSTAPGSEPRYRAQVPRQALGPGEKRPRLSSCISRLSLWQDRTPSTYDAKENFILALGFGGSVHSDLAPRQKLARWRAGRGRPPSLGWLGSNKTRIQPCGARACTPPSNRAQSTRCHLISG